MRSTPTGGSAEHAPGSAASTILERENGGRPPVQVWGTRGMVVAMHPAAAQVGHDVLRRGGSAFDAGIAVSAALAVVSPDWAGTAGDIAWLLYRAEDRRFAHLDGYSTCPRSMNAGALARRYGVDVDVPSRALREEPPGQRGTGLAASMVPGTPATWDVLAHEWGSLPLRELLQPAIELAASGFVVNRYLAESFRMSRDKLLTCEPTCGAFCDAPGRLPCEGDRLVQRDLAETLAEVARDGASAFYRGAAGRRIAESSMADGGTIDVDDLAAYQPAWRPTLEGTYRGHQIVTTGWPASGLHLLQALAVLDPFDLVAAGYHSVRSLHLMIEATKQALADRRAHGGDPDRGSADSASLLHASRIDAMRSAIRPDAALAVDGIASTGGSTTHFVVRDVAGNIASATQSLGSRFGCGAVVEGTGLLMNDRSWWMALVGGPNAVAPGRRANIGHAPLVVCRQGQPAAALGSPGGFGIVPYLVQTIVNMLDYDLDIQEAIEAPRFRLEGVGRRVWVEERIDANVRAGLRAMGHEIVDYPGWTDRLGGVEGLSIDRTTGAVLGGYDPRRNSFAAGLH